jgi:hypothetical protein
MNYKQLEQKIIQSYQEGVTPLTGETLAAEFLAAQISVSEEIKRASIKARLSKSVVKEERGKLLYKEATTPEKKPSDTLLNALVDSNIDILACQMAYDKDEETANELERLYNIFREAHIFYRGVAKGKFD